MVVIVALLCCKTWKNIPKSSITLSRPVRSGCGQLIGYVKVENTHSSYCLLSIVHRVFQIARFFFQKMSKKFNVFFQICKKLDMRGVLTYDLGVI